MIIWVFNFLKLDLIKKYLTDLAGSSNLASDNGNEAILIPELKYGMRGR